MNRLVYSINTVVIPVLLLGTLVMCKKKDPEPNIILREPIDANSLTKGGTQLNAKGYDNLTDSEIDVNAYLDRSFKYFYEFSAADSSYAIEVEQLSQSTYPVAKSNSFRYSIDATYKNGELSIKRFSISIDYKDSPTWSINEYFSIPIYFDQHELVLHEASFDASTGNLKYKMQVVLKTHGYYWDSENSYSELSDMQLIFDSDLKLEKKISK